MIFNPVERFVNAEEFTRETVKRIQAVVGKEKVYIPVSGGVDSTSVACLLSEATDGNIVAEHYDHGGMRKNECEAVVSELKKYFPVSLYDASNYFMDMVIEAGEDAEKKRIAVSTGYFLTAHRRLQTYGCKFMADGTIEPDWLETVKLGLKWQHNIPTDEIRKMYEETGVQFIHPLYYQAKPQSRAVAAYYGVVSKERQPFPGPGLYVRCVGQVSREKMRILKEADSIATPKLGEIIDKMNIKNDKQWFCAIIDSEKQLFNGLRGTIGGKTTKTAYVYKTRVTGMFNNQRTYRKLLSVQSDANISDLAACANDIIRENASQEIGRVSLNLKTRRKGKFTAILRAIETIDFKKADVIPIPMSELEPLANKILDSVPEIAAIDFDITPKPDSTIEFE
jgi:GMP synthase (glutamine-hydrolysing)